MKVLWVFAHPDQSSLNGSLRDEGIRALEAGGHACRVSDLYAMKWKATVDGDDFGDDRDARLRVADASERAYQTGALSADIRAEHEKLDWADAVVLQFPLWWFGMPAILKGWVDRVFVRGYAYGVFDEQGRALRYGHGKLAGKRALVVLTTGSREAPFGPRGINGQLDQVLFPILHGMLWYTGMSVLPPVAVHAADRLTERQYADAAEVVRDRILSIMDTDPLPFRYQNGGDYDENLVLRPEIAPDMAGVEAHYRR